MIINDYVINKLILLLSYFYPKNYFKKIDIKFRYIHLYLYLIFHYGTG